MTTLIVASFGRVLLTIAYVAVSVLIIGLILLQKNRGSGLSGAFGGVGGHTAFGTKTGDFLTWVTVSLTAIFLLLSIVGNYVFEPEKTGAATPAQTAPTSPSPVSPLTPVKKDTVLPPGSTPGGGSPVQVQPVTASPSDTPPPPAPPTSGPGH